MKSLGLNGVGGARFYVTLLVFTCTTILICAWGRTSLVARFLPQQLQGVVVPSEVRSGVPLADRNPLEFLPSEKGSGSSRVPEAEGGVAPAGPARTGEEEEDADTGLPDPSREDCNYAKGKWVLDEKRPLYSGFECKQWLSLMWACRLTPRTDFSFEAFKWKPNDCNMPDFKGPTFLKRMKNKTIAFVGDSLGRQQFQSLMCMATGGKMDLEVKDVGIEYGLVKAPGALRPDGWVYRFPRTNTTVLYYWSASLCELEPLDISNATTSIAMHLDRPATFLKKYISRFDVLVLNTGHHWNKGKLKGNRWEMYANGAPIKDPNLALIENAKNLTIYTVAKWVDSQLSQYPRLKAFFRTISPRHFINGDWNTGGGCNNTIPLLFGSQVSQNGSSDLVVEGALRGTRVKILDITALSQLRDEGHISKYSHKGITAMQDCLHWCLPGIPDSWNEILFAQL